MRRISNCARKKQSSSSGSKALPRSSAMMASDCAALIGALYGRRFISASNTSAIATMRPNTGICSPFKPCG